MSVQVLSGATKPPAELLELHLFSSPTGYVKKMRRAREARRLLAVCRDLAVAPAAQAGEVSVAARFFSSSGAVSAPTHLEDEPYCRQRNVLVLGNRIPFLAPDAWVAPNAILVGDVDLFDQVGPGPPLPPEHQRAAGCHQCLTSVGALHSGQCVVWLRPTR